MIFKNNVFIKKIINFSFSLLFLSLIIVGICGCNKNNSESKFVYFQNVYNFENCYVYDGSTNFPGILMNTHQQDIYIAEIKNDNLIFNDGKRQLPEVIYDKNNPVYANGFVSTDYLKYEYQKVFLSVELNELNDNYLVSSDYNNINHKCSMIYLEKNIYMGYILKNSSYKYFKNNEQYSETLIYDETKIHYLNKNLSIYTPYQEEFLNNASDAQRRIFFEKPSNWHDVYCYVWNDSGNELAWPGKIASKYNENIYYYDINDNYPNYIFNCGLNKDGINITQTADLKVNDTSNYKNPVYSFDKGLYELPTFNPVSENNVLVYFKKPSNWTNCYISYPLEKELTLYKEDIYFTKIPSDTKEIIFKNDNNLSTMTLLFNEINNYYDGVWKENNFDSSDDDYIVNPNLDESLVYDMLFDKNNIIKIEIDISKSEISKLQKDYEKFLNINSKSPIYRMCNLNIYINNYLFKFEEVGIRMKGNTSRTNFYNESSGIYNLIHYKLSFDETFDDEDDYELNERKIWKDNSLRKERKNRTFATLSSFDLKWNKNFDSTHIKTMFAYEFYRINGIYAPLSTLSAVSITQFGFLQNLGIFDLTESVDNTFLEKRLTDEDCGGDLYKVGWDNQNGGKLTLDTIYGIGIENEHKSYFPIYDLKTNKKSSSHEQLINLINLINSDNPDLDSIVNIDYFLKYCALAYILGNPDDLRNNYNNYYIYFLKSNNKMIIIPYDLDRCLGITKDWNPSSDAMTSIDPFSKNNFCGEQENQLILKTVCYGANEEYIDQYTAYLKEFANSQYFSNEYFNSVYNIYKANLEKYAIPTINSIKDKGILFNLNDNINLSFDKYIIKIKNNINNL